MKTSFHILYMHHGSGKAGAANALLRLLVNLEKNSYASTIACNFKKNNARVFWEEHGFAPIHCPTAIFSHVAAWWPLYKPRALAKAMRWLLIDQPRSATAFNKLLKQTKPDLVHLNSLTIAPLAPIAKRMGIPVVLHVREPVAEGSCGIRQKWLRHLAVKFADHIIYICNDNQDRLTGPMLFASVLYDPVPFDIFDRHLDRNAARNALGIPLSAKVLFFPGGSSLGIKGIFPFLEALAIIRTKSEDICALIPGIDAEFDQRQNPERVKVEQMIRDLDLESSIVRAPFTSSVESYYAASDIVMVPFTTPHFSMAVLEAGAMAKPVIGSRIGGIEEVLQDGENGLLVAPSDTRKLADKTRHILQDPVLMETLGNNGYRMALDRCEAQAYADRVSSIYERILEN